ncbi:hypothetical protein PFDG_05453 [Plasmodium falciparum Dd2]|uniref:Uncharacterized protein n=1 Tax=Plasmodium falciparum (isolate Dd2) TaxID=57267 RepID=A0A0L7M087_PLAF4|nr:hypothetical protein PFDG_05453 [Plasmodium falciparum Dd2]
MSSKMKKINHLMCPILGKLIQ